MAKRGETTADSAVNYVMTYLVNSGATPFRRSLEEYIPDELTSKLGLTNKEAVIKQALEKLLKPLLPNERDDFTHEPNQSVMVRRVKQVIAEMCQENGVQSARAASV